MAVTVVVVIVVVVVVFVVMTVVIIIIIIIIILSYLLIICGTNAQYRRIEAGAVLGWAGGSGSRGQPPRKLSARTAPE